MRVLVAAQPNGLSTSDTLVIPEPVRITMTDVNTATVAKRNIATIRTSGAKLDTLIHTTAMIIMRRGAPVEAGGEGHGDVSLLLPLIAAMPKSGRPKALLAWFQTFSPITVNGDGDKAGITKGEKARPWMLADAEATPFWLLNPEKDVQVFDFDKAMQSLLNRYEKQVKDGTLKPDALLQQRIASARKLVKAAK